MSDSRTHASLPALALLLLVVSATVLPSPAEAGFFFGRRQQSQGLSWFPRRNGPAQAAVTATTTTTSAPSAGVTTKKQDGKAMISMPNFNPCGSGYRRARDGSCRRVFG